MKYTLEIYGADVIEHYKIMLFGPTYEKYAISCVCYTLESAGLPSTVSLTDIYAYAALNSPEPCTILAASLHSEFKLNIRSKVKFDGTRFVEEGSIDEVCDYAIKNSSSTQPLTIGLSQKIAVNGQQAIVPIDQRQLRINMSGCYSTPNSYWIGAGYFSNNMEAKAGLVLSTNMVQASNAFLGDRACVQALTPFTKVDFTQGTCLKATYCETDNLFKISQLTA